MNSPLVPIILSGGNGTRLWPLSREEYPKQFLKLTDSMSMLQSTISRLATLNTSSPVVICNELHRFIVAEQLRQLNKLDNNIILEPLGRNTAPAICIAALILKMKCPNENPLMLVLPADHSVKNVEIFCDTIKNAISFAEAGNLVSFGIKPTRPEIGYGYIQKGKVLSDSNTFEVSEVRSFVEKPNLKKAEEFIEKDEYYWNSGMYLFSVERYLQELALYRPDIVKVCQETVNNIHYDMDFIRLDEKIFRNCPEDSIDYAVMEKTKDAVVATMDIGWNDVGAWSSLWELGEKDPAGNVIMGDIICHETENSYIYTESGLVATIDIQDLVIIQTKDSLLVSKRDSVQNVKNIVQYLNLSGRKEHKEHREIFKSWGRCDSIDSSEKYGYQVKRITVNPRERLSLQLHHHRAEHWVIVMGIAKVTVAEQMKILKENESVYIPAGTKHSLENIGETPLILIEVWTGSRLNDDDIIRF
ncbi:mannose-1-phosphate guanylyltransferase/mannose-6-phosphate isomerase [Escherichia coli]|nr:mannose-1-phosphate guanylyltransferase/mannose-6-phosphate isomerase [Escherichia coli]HAX3822977.1 mannose-1-phosphate guanylyltransferase/mannose-6-phosphate isomerase [Escherichia coli]HCQ0563720.1 mannose-1-phosphate guanylyltransferase/mannose-6-phosphate isomerase [Escherichia coli]